MIHCKQIIAQTGGNMAKTYIENNKLPDVKEEYTEESIAEKLNNRLRELRSVMRSNNEEETEATALLEQTRTDLENGQETAYNAEELGNQEQVVQSEFDNQVYMEEAREITKQQQWLKEYGPSFVQLYQIKEEHEKRGEPEKLILTEIDLAENRDILTEDQYNKMNADPEGKLRELALRVEDGEDNFDIVMTEYHIPNSDKQVKMQLSFDDNTLEQINAEKLKRIFEFCEKYGLSTTDMSIHYGYDGSIDVSEELRVQQNRLNEMVAQARDMMAKEGQVRDDLEGKQVEEHTKSVQKEFDDVVAANGGVVPEGLSKDDIAEKPIIEDSELLAEGKLPTTSDKDDFDNTTAHNAQATDPNDLSSGAPTPQPTKKKESQSEAEKLFESWIGTSKGLSKRKGYSYYKRHTGLFGRGWTQFIVYDNEDKDNLLTDGRQDKDGHYKWHYSFKLYVKVDENGLHLAYRTPNNKKMDETVVGGIAGQLKDLGYTHVNFPSGIPDVEKSMWRKALAEKGIVPVGIGLDRSKAEGMLKAAKEKLSTEEYNKFRWKLGLQMDKNNKSKGKVVDSSEQAFIDGLINTHKYAAFTDGFTLTLKSKMKKMLREKNPEMGAVLKIATFRTLSHLYEIYAYAIENGINLTDHPKLTPDEKRKINDLNLNGNPQEFNLGQMEALFDILMKKQVEETKTEMYAQLIEERTNPAVFAKRSPKVIINELYKNARNGCEAINEDLAAKGIEEIALIKSFDVPLEYADFLNNYWPEYSRNHPTSQTRTGSNNEHPSDEKEGKPIEKAHKKVREISKGTAETVSKDKASAFENNEDEPRVDKEDKSTRTEESDVKKNVRESMRAAREFSSVVSSQVKKARDRGA